MHHQGRTQQQQRNLLAAHWPTSGETGGSDCHPSDTEHYYAGVVYQRHKVIQRLCAREGIDVGIATSRCYLGLAYSKAVAIRISVKSVGDHSGSKRGPIGHIPSCVKMEDIMALSNIQS